MTRSAGKNTLVMMAFILLSRVLGVVRDIVINRIYGLNLATDVYTAAFRIPDILQYLVAGGALATVFVPVFVEQWEKGQQRDAWKVFGTVITLAATLATVLVVLLEIFAYPVARWMNPNIGLPEHGTPTPEDLKNRLWAWQEITRLSRILLPAQLCFFVGGLMMGTLNARNRFWIPAIGPIVYNGLIIVGGLTQISVPRESRDLGAMCWGALIGAVVGNFILPLFDLKRAGAKFWLGYNTAHPAVRKVLELLLPAMLGLSLSQVGWWITGWFTSGSGPLSALRNGYNLTQAPIGIFAQASAIVIFPTISAMAARGEMKEFRREIHYGIRRILFLTVPASLLMAVLADPIVTAIYFKNEFTVDSATGAFTTRNLHMTSAALVCYSLGTFAWSAQAVLARGFFAMQNSKTPLNITKVMILVFAALCFVFRWAGLDFRWLAVALSVAGTLNMLVFFRTLQKFAGGLNLKALAKASAKICLAAGLSSGVAWLFLRFFWHEPTEATQHGAQLHSLGVTLLASAAALAVYVVASLVLRVPELRTIRDMFRRKPAATSEEAETPIQTPLE